MAANNNGHSCILGIDLGTTTIKVALIDENTKTVLHTLSRETKASVSSELESLGNEQDPRKIITALQFCVSRLPKDAMPYITKIGISGQMHGCMLWKEGDAWKQNSFGRFEISTVSQLFTWQDGRCSKEFISSLPSPKSHLRLSTGHGCATLFWLKKNKGDFLLSYDCSGTIQDFVVAMLCGLKAPIMSIQNAASWGYFDTVAKTWNLDILDEAEFPIHLLPQVNDSDSVAGTVNSNWYGVSQGTPVLVALGDMQCSVLSTLHNEQDAVLNISTSAQLSFIMPEGFLPPPLDPNSAVEYFPYFRGRYLAVAASLNGGNVLAAFVKMLQQWTHDLGNSSIWLYDIRIHTCTGIPEDKIWEKILALAEDNPTTDSDIIICPTLYGERHLPDQKANVSNISSLSLSLGKVMRALCKSVISNLHSMMSRDFLVQSGISKIVGSGTALKKNIILRQELELAYKLPINMGDGSDAAVGVALAALSSKNNRNKTASKAEFIV